MKLADFHYMKATNIYSSLSLPPQTIRTVLERAGLLEASITTLKSEVGRYRAQLQVLDCILETRTVLGEIVSRMEKVSDEVEAEEEQKMLRTILQRLQATLLSLVKSGGTASRTKKSKTDSEAAVIKSLYGKALKVSVKDDQFIQELLKLMKNIEEERGNL